MSVSERLRAAGITLGLFSAVTGLEVKEHCDRTGASPSCRFTLAAR